MKYKYSHHKFYYCDINLKFIVIVYERKSNYHTKNKKDD